jgi:hypothetical protein
MASLNDFIYTDDVDDVLAVYVNNLLGSSMRSEYKNVETLAADKTLTDADTPIQRLNCNGAARIVKMPTANAVENHPFFIVNSSAGAYAITVKSNDAATIYATIDQGRSALLLPDGAGGYTTPVTDIETKYKFTPTVATNNLTLTLTHMDGTTPSASRPLWFRIGDTMRAVTAALSVTITAGAASFAHGTELAAKEMDYFAYVSWRAASSAVVLGFSRLPYATLYSDFSATANTQNYAPFSTAPAATDDVVNIGMFAASNSGTASFNWSVPTFNSRNLVQRPCYETRNLVYVATNTGFTATIPTGTYNYRIINKTCRVYVRQTVNGTSNATGFTISLPIAAKTLTDYQVTTIGGFVVNNGVAVNGGSASIISAATTILLGIDQLGTAWTNANGKRISAVVLDYDLAD